MKNFHHQNFKLDSITEGYLCNILKNVEVTKVAGIDQISGKFLKRWNANFSKTY